MFQHWSGHLHVGAVDLDTVDPPDQDQDLVHTLGTQDVRKRPTAANVDLTKWPSQLAHSPVTNASR